MAKRDIVYVPILKSKAAERSALSHVTPERKAKLRPLLELHPHGAKALGDHVEDICEALQSAWGVNRWFYGDTIWLHGTTGSPAIISETFEAMRNCDLESVQVVRTTYDDASLQQLQDIITDGDRGYLLRITPDVLDTPVFIGAVVDSLGLSRDKVDLLLDYRQHPMTLADHIGQIPNLGEWRSLIAASGVFPKSLLNFPLRQWHTIQRHDFLSWQEGVGSSLKRNPIYSDYTMRAPGPPADFGEPSVNLRYARKDCWLVQVGGKHKDGAAVEMHTMASELVARPEYLGPDFGTGDEEIERVTDEDEGPGGPTQWLQWCVSHHMEFVVEQLSSGGA